MRFDQLSFWILFAVAWLAWRYLPFRAAKAAVLVLSLVFYAWWRPEYILLILVSAAVDYFAAGRIYSSSGGGARRAWLGLSLTVNLGLLAFFKYAPLFMDAMGSIAPWFGRDPASFALEGWVVPVGISFYTFQTLSYSLDVYRGQLAPAKRFQDFLLYVAFFPQLVAGPIVRAADLLPQFVRRRRLTPAAVQMGVYCILQGLFLKVVVADNLAPVVESVFRHGAGRSLSPLEAWLGTLYFGGQIFADFAGYSRIAIGLAYLMGLRFPENFRYPYISQSLSEFWTRWHITLSGWLRDYLYIPLGGNRRGAARTNANLLITMLLGGLWHGAAFTFVAWGGLHGAALVVERAIMRWNSGRRESAPRLAATVGFLRALAVFLVVHVAWVFFRAPDFRTAAHLLLRMFVGPFSGPIAGLETLGGVRHLVLLFPIAALHLAQWAHERHGFRKTPARRMLVAVACALGLVVFQRATDAPFLYFQF